MEMDSLRGELERWFELDELLKLSSDLLGFDPQAVGGASGKASFVRALIDYCRARDALDALCDAAIATKPNADVRLALSVGAGVSQSRELSPGEALESYRITQLIGSGPQGSCYEADRDGVAYRIKLLHPETERDARGLQRFLTFNRILAQLDHPTLPQSLRIEQSDHGIAVAQRWLPGESLAARLAQGGPLRATEVRAVMVEVVRGLAELHARGLSHGNLKVENIIVATDDDGKHAVQLQDAGADLLGARRAGNGLIQVLSLASPKTVAPERLRGRARGPAEDVYAVGAICYELVSGSSPFSGATAIDSALRHLTGEPDAPSKSAPVGWLTLAFEAFILRLLDKDPERRPADGLALLNELRDLAGSETDLEPTETEIEARIAALLSDPESDESAQALDTVAVGSFRNRAYEGFVSAADSLNADDPKLRRIKAALLLRAASGLSAMRQLEAAEAAYVKLIQLGNPEPGHLNALDDVRRQLGKHDEIVEGLLARIETIEAPKDRGAVMARIAEIYTQHLHDETQAVVALSQALAEDPHNRAYVRRIEELSGGNSKLWSEVLAACSEAASDETRAPAERAPLLEQIGVWYTDKQGRPELALPCFQTALQLDPSNARALDGVASVYRANKMWSELGDLLVHRADAATSPSDARELRTQAAQVLEKHLQDVDGAQELYERIIREDPGDLVVGQALSRIYEQNHELDRLVPLLQRQAAEERGARRHTALCRLGDLQRSHLGDLDEARRSYEAVLEENPTHPQANAGLDQTLAQAGKFKDLLSNLHRQLAHSPTPRQQVALWERIASIYENEFLLHADAAVALESLLRLDPSRIEALTSLARLYRILERWDDLAKIYQRHIDLLDEAEERLPLYTQRARVLAEHVGDLPGAIQVYEQIAQAAPDRLEALEAIADMNEALGNLPEAILAVQALADRVSEKDGKIRYFMRIAKLFEARGRIDESTEWYSRVVALDPTHSKATQALRQAYAERGDTEGLIELLTRDIQQTESERNKARLSVEIASLELTQNRDPVAAERAARQALDWDPSNLRALILVGDMAFGARRYSEALEQYQSAIPRADSLPESDAARLITRYLDAASHSPTRSPEQMLRHAETLRGLTPDDPAALTRLADLSFFHASPEQTASLYQELLDRFKDDLTADQLAAASYRLGESLRLGGELDRALLQLDDATERAPDSLHPLVSRIQIYEIKQDWANVVETKRKLLNLLEADQRAELQLELGELLLEKLSEPVQALVHFEAASELRPNDRRVLMRLMQIHSERESWPELVEVVNKLSGFVDDPTLRSKYLMTAAMVSSRQLAQREQAIGFYRQVLALDPRHSKALSEYVVLQIELGDSAAAGEALRTRLELAHEQGDSATELEMLDALFTLLNGNPGQLDAVVHLVERARELEPQNPVHASRLKDLYEKDTAQYLDRAVALHVKALRQRPNDEESYRRLRKLYTEGRRADAAWCLCQVLHLLKLSEPEEARFFERGHVSEPAPARAALEETDWHHYLVHPRADPRLTQIFALLEPVVVAARGQSLLTLGYDPRLAADLAQHPYPLGHMLFFAAGVLGIPLPPTFENHHEPGGLLYLNSNPPSIVMGVSALQQLPLQTAAFIAARQLANYRPGFLLRHLLSSIPVLKAWLFAAFKTCSPNFPISPELEGPVMEARSAIERFLTPTNRDRLVENVSRLLASSSAVDLKEWVAGVDLTADRAGFLVANDLKSVTDIIKSVEDPSAPPRDRRIQELILFAIDESFFALRRRLGVALESS